MSELLPDRPDLGQLRRRAKELRDAAQAGDQTALARLAAHHEMTGRRGVALAAAQLVIARELGFPSWPRLRAGVEAAAAGRPDVSALLGAVIDGRHRRAAEILAGDPGICGRDLRAAAVVGDAAAAGGLLAADTDAALAVDDERGWPPLLYVCYSTWHHVDPARAEGLAEVARLLVDAGASPDTNDGGRLRYRSALKGSVEVNNPAVTEVLLAAGAHPDPGQPIVDAIGHGDHRCLQLLLAHGARVERTWAVGAAVDRDDHAALVLLLDALAAAGAPVSEIATEALPEAAAKASPAVVAALLEAGARPDAAGTDGMSALCLAVRAGRQDVAGRLADAGALDDATEVDRFLGACRGGDQAQAQQLLGSHPNIWERMTDDDRAAIVDAAGMGPAEAVALMIDLGFPADARKDGDEALHNAAYHGNAEVIRVLLEKGADVDARDGRFDATPLGFATVGSGERAGRPGDWVGTVRLLVGAGASTEEAWVPGKPPSEEVADVLLSYGIHPSEPDTEQDPDDEPQAGASKGSGVMADIADALEAAHAEGDLELLASLLHPEVRWTGECTNKAQVLDWYRDLLAEGTQATVHSVEVDGDAVILGLSVTRTAKGARPAPAQRLYQVFTVAGAQIVEIHGYPDRATAHARPTSAERRR
ncbi:MAG TPA: ankyrin repeat domain-containing protein [Acidimicrobiales bacterium]|nr:ankyrin repeat domain-containing protein [Acidimicrobiales bacterium]